VKDRKTRQCVFGTRERGHGACCRVFVTTKKKQKKQGKEKEKGKDQQYALGRCRRGHGADSLVFPCCN